MGRMTGSGLTLIRDPHSGRTVIEGLTAAELEELAGDLVTPAREVNCARPSASPPLSRGSGPRVSYSKMEQARAIVDPGVARLDGADMSGLQATASVMQASASFRVRVRVHRVYHGSVVDGPGRRSVLQMQGCPLRCPGCYVPETHEPGGGVELSAGEAVDLLLDPAGEPRDGATVLGGEPFAQPAALAAILRELEARGVHRTVYSGYTFEALCRRPEPEMREALILTSLLIDGPYRRRLSGHAGEWRGSRNQRLIPLPGLWL